jgi:Zn finger protein HypA/HybF involved in hydrogenase expression
MKHKLVCLRCGKEWESEDKFVDRCPCCKSYKYDTPPESNYIHIVRIKKNEV